MPQKPLTFYPTYKEWKLGDTLDKKFGKFAFYPTYKEWKLLKPSTL